MSVNLAGIIIAVVSAAVGAVTMAAAPSIGISEANALPFGLLVGGIIACLASWHQSISGNPNSIILPLWMYGTAAAIFGVLGLIGLVPFSDAPPLSREEAKRLDEITEKLRRFPASGSNRKAGELAQQFRGALMPHVRKLSGGDKVSVYVDLGGEGEKVKAASLFVRVEGADRMKDDDKKQLLSVCMKHLQMEFPQGACNVAIEGPKGWVAQSRATGAKMPGVPEIGSDPPRF